MPAKRTREHIIADLGCNFVERQVLLCGYTEERIRRDYGIDQLIYTFNDAGEFEVESILVQTKATDHLNVLADGQTISFVLDRTHIESWRKPLMPCILVVYDAQEDVGY